MGRFDVCESDSHSRGRSNVSHFSDSNEMYAAMHNADFNPQARRHRLGYFHMTSIKAQVTHEPVKFSARF